MKRKMHAILLASCLVCTNLWATTSPMTLIMDGTTITYNLPAISLYVNNKPVETKVMAPIELNNRVLVPAREVFEAMGATVVWEHAVKRVTVEYKNSTIILEINNNSATINGVPVTMDVTGKIINDKVMIPVRFVSEALGFTVDWKSSDRSVWITEPEENIEEDVLEDKLVISGQSYMGKDNIHGLSVPTISGATTQIQNVQVSENQNVAQVSIQATSSIGAVEVSRMDGKVVIDIKNSKSNLASQITPGINTYVKSIRTSQFTSDTTRVVLDLQSGAKVGTELTLDRTGLVVTLSKQNLEGMEVITTSGKDMIVFTGLGTSQFIAETERGKNAIYFTLPNVAIRAKVVQWSGIKGDFIDQIEMQQVGNNVQGTIILKSAAQYEVQSHTGGARLVISTNEAEVTPTPPTDEELEEEDSKPEETIGTWAYVPGSKPQLTFSAISGLNMNQVKVTDDYRNRKLIVDLGGSYSDVIKTQTLQINDGKVKTIQVSNTGNTVITIETQTVYAYQLSQSNQMITLEVMKPRALYNQIIVLDIGHGGSDSGAVFNGLKEKDVNYNQGMALYRLLEADSQIKVYMTRETDVYPTLQFRSTLANEIEAHLFVSIHNNSASSTSVNGAETLYYPSTNDARGKAIAQLVQNSLVNDSGMTNRGIKARSDLHVLRETQMPAILIETGFLSNTSDASRINTSSFISTWSQGVYRAIIEGFKLL